MIPGILIFTPSADARIAQNILKCDLIAREREAGGGTPKTFGEKAGACRGICLDVSAHAPGLTKIDVRKSVAAQFLVRCTRYRTYEIGSEIQSTRGIRALYGGVPVQVRIEIFW